jgi:hypothetical protein
VNPTTSAYCRSRAVAACSSANYSLVHDPNRNPLCIQCNASSKTCVLSALQHRRLLFKSSSCLACTCIHGLVHALPFQLQSKITATMKVPVHYGTCLQVLIRGLSFAFMPMTIHHVRIKPYVGLVINNNRATAHYTSRVKGLRSEVIPLITSHRIYCNPSSDVLSIELWQKRRLRRDVLVSSLYFQMSLKSALLMMYKFDRNKTLTWMFVCAASDGNR